VFKAGGRRGTVEIEWGCGALTARNVEGLRISISNLIFRKVRVDSCIRHDDEMCGLEGRFLLRRRKVEADYLWQESIKDRCVYNQWKCRAKVIKFFPEKAVWVDVKDKGNECVDFCAIWRFYSVAGEQWGLTKYALSTGKWRSDSSEVLVIYIFKVVWEENLEVEVASYSGTPDMPHQSVRCHIPIVFSHHVNLCSALWDARGNLLQVIVQKWNCWLWKYEKLAFGRIRQGIKFCWRVRRNR